VPVETFGGDEIHEAEPACIVKSDRDAVFRQDHDVIVRSERRRVASLDAKVPGHTEVREPYLGVVEADQQVLAASLDALDAPSAEPLGERRRQGKAEVRAPLRNPDESLADQHRDEPPPYRLDFGKFGHGAG
jgi:hypothetical protein